MDTDLAARLDRSIGPAPDDAPELAELLDLGHRTVRRRRLAAGAASALAVVVLCGGAALATGGSSDRTGTPPVAADPTAAATPTAPAEPAPSEPGASEPVPAVPAPSEPIASEPVPAVPDLPGNGDLELATYDAASDEVVLHPGTTVLQRVDDPYDLRRGEGSVGLELGYEGGRYFWMLHWGSSGTGMAAQPVPDAEATLEQFLRRVDPTLRTQEVPGEPSDLVGFAAPGGELLVPRAGVVILEHREGVDVGPSFASAADDTAVAHVRVRGGAEFFVLARRAAGAAEEDAQYIKVLVTPELPDLDAFLTFARTTYAEGGGGLL